MPDGPHDRPTDPSFSLLALHLFLLLLVITGGTWPDAAAAPAALLPDGDDDDDMIMCCNATVVSLTVPSSVSQQLTHRQLLFSGYKL